MFVFRNFTVENLFPENFVFSGYEDISHIPQNENELIWFYLVPINFSQRVKTEIINSYFEKLSFVISSLKGTQHLLICSLLDIFPTDIIDSDSSAIKAVESFNERMTLIAEADNRISFIDIREYFNRFPETDWINWKYYFISRMIVSPKIASGFYSWLSHRMKQKEGFRKKCLVLDLDNTLWGGILGEDGIEGIKTGGDYPGNVYQYFQEALIDLSETGIILTVCSKNNEEDVKELWKRNPFVKITEKHLAAWRINWNNKADNIREIAAELNIGLDSMVFLDDNPTERELIRQQLPMVCVPEFPSRPYQLLHFLKEVELQYFRATSLTKEDLNKTDQYKANAKRASLVRNFTNLEEYIKSLDITIDIFKADSFTVARIAQMTQKTNQFNLTTRRYLESEINSFIEKGNWVLGASVKDRFGDNGITGAAIIKINGTSAHIDSFLLSCRILGKKIENTLLSVILNKLIESGVEEVTAEYIPTLKNQQVSSFYPDNGFKVMETDKSGKTFYLLSLNNRSRLNDLYTINIKF